MAGTVGGGVSGLVAAPVLLLTGGGGHPPKQIQLCCCSIKLNKSANKIINNPRSISSSIIINKNKNRNRRRIRGRKGVESIRCQVSQSSSSSDSDDTGGGSSSSPVEVYQGVYGPWSVDSSDVTEVILYRTGLVTAAASFVTAASTAFLPDKSDIIINNNIDILYALGAAGLGLSLLLIHIYVTEIKRTLQALWALGILGSFATYFTLAQPAGDNLVHYVVHNPSAVWFVGPLFASLTGLVFKEGLCYGKLEAGILTFIIPSLLLGHLSGLMDDGVKVTLLGIWMALFVIFAGRKFTQPIKDDIGDKSVFIFNALPEGQKKALMEKLQQQKLTEET